MGLGNMRLPMVTIGDKEYLDYEAAIGIIQHALDETGAAGLALRFVLAHPGVDVALSGMGGIAMVDQNVADASVCPQCQECLASAPKASPSPISSTRWTRCWSR